MLTPDLKPLLDATVAILKEQGADIPVVELMPTFEELFRGGDSDDSEYLPDLKHNGADDPICILHSSGVSRCSDL